MQSTIALALSLALLIVSSFPVALAHETVLFDLRSVKSLQCEARSMVYNLLLQQEREIFPSLPRNLLILFLVLSFLVPIVKYVFRRLKAQVEELLAASNQDEEDLELNE